MIYLFILILFDLIFLGEGGISCGYFCFMFLFLCICVVGFFGGCCVSLLFLFDCSVVHCFVIGVFPCNVFNLILFIYCMGFCINGCCFLVGFWVGFFSLFFLFSNIFTF